MNSLLKILLAIFIAAFALSCTNSSEIGENHEKPKGQSGELILSNDFVKRAGLEYGKIEKVKLSQDVSARGRFKVLPSASASISVMMGGVIQKIYISEGDNIKEGQIVATFSHPDFIQMQTDFLQAKIEEKQLRTEFERQKKLYQQNVKSEKEFNEFKSKYERAVVTAMSAKAKLELIKLDPRSVEEEGVINEVPIRSPLNGIVDNVDAEIGMYADMQTELFRVIDKNNMVLELKVFEKDLDKIKKGQRVSFSASGNEPTMKDAIIKNITASVDFESRVANIIAKPVDITPSAFPGMFVSSKIHTDEEDVDALPIGAIVIETDENIYGFYTTDPAGSQEYTFYKFQVEKGFEEDGFVQITLHKPLPEDARIVTSGVYYLKSEMHKIMEE